MVHSLHSPEYRLQQRQHGLRRDGPRLGDHLFQGSTLQELHDDVGSVMFRKVIQHLDDLRDTVQFGHGLGLPEELLPALFIGGLVPAGVTGHIQGKGNFPTHQEGGEILLYSHLPLEHRVPPQVGDAESTLSQCPAQLIAILEQTSRG